MYWRSRFHHLKHPKPRSRVRQPLQYFYASQWPRFSKGSLIIAIRRLAREEWFASGPAKARFRGKRLRAVEVFRSRFGEAPALERYGKRQTPLD
jgi:hypothetical protein